MKQVHIITKDNYKSGGEFFTVPDDQEFLIDTQCKDIGIYKVFHDDKNYYRILCQLVRSFNPDDVLVIHPMHYVDHDMYDHVNNDAYKKFARARQIDVFYGPDKFKIFTINRVIYENRILYSDAEGVQLVSSDVENTNFPYDVYFEDHTNTNIFIKRHIADSNITQKIYVPRKKVKYV